MGLQPEATQEQVVWAYHCISSSLRFEDARADLARFQQMHISYEILITHRLRRAYDEGGVDAVAKVADEGSWLVKTEDFRNRDEMARLELYNWVQAQKRELEWRRDERRRLAYTHPWRVTVREVEDAYACDSEDNGGGYEDCVDDSYQNSDEGADSDDCEDSEDGCKKEEDGDSFSQNGSLVPNLSLGGSLPPSPAATSEDGTNTETPTPYPHIVLNVPVPCTGNPLLCECPKCMRSRAEYRWYTRLKTELWTEATVEHAAEPNFYEPASLLPPLGSKAPRRRPAPREELLRMAEEVCKKKTLHHQHRQQPQQWPVLRPERSRRADPQQDEQDQSLNYDPSPTLEQLGMSDQQNQTYTRENLIFSPGNTLMRFGADTRVATERPVLKSRDGVTRREGAPRPLYDDVYRGILRDLGFGHKIEFRDEAAPEPKDEAFESVADGRFELMDPCDLTAAAVVVPAKHRRRKNKPIAPRRRKFFIF